jgi:hypothetical protein
MGRNVEDTNGSQAEDYEHRLIVHGSNYDCKHPSLNVMDKLERT